MNTKVIIVSVVLILAGICGTSVLAGVVLGANSTAIRGMIPVSNSTDSGGGLISPIVIIKSPPSIYTFEQYLQMLLDANDGSATLSIVAKGGVLTISSPSIDFKSDNMTLTATNFKCVIDKNTGITTVIADSIKYVNGDNRFSADNFVWSMAQAYSIYNSDGSGVIPPVSGK
ncbi:MAG: hypothetical protein ABSA11_04035 [Candidatus Bathyarchaeia archaeon]|jgi:hypothetical protein